MSHYLRFKSFAMKWDWSRGGNVYWRKRREFTRLGPKTTLVIGPLVMWIYWQYWERSGSGE